MKVTNSLLVVYKEKDAHFFKHLKELINSFDDTNEAIVGTEDGTVKVMRCEEQKWLEWTKRDNSIISRMADKFLFIDEDKKGLFDNPLYSRYGVSFGIINENFFSIKIDDNYSWTEYEYQAFSKELKELVDKEIAEVNVYELLQASKEKAKEKAGLAALALALFPPAVPFAGGAVAADTAEVIRNKKLLRDQMLYFALSKAYYEGLEDFMKS